MDSQRPQMRAVREGDTALIECDVCGPLAVLTGDLAAESVLVTAHMIEHRTGSTVAINQ